MPEYLAPGVYVEEVSFRSKSIQGVPTSTTGFAGLTHYGPVQYVGGPRATEPRLVTSYAEFERVYGGLDPYANGLSQQLPYLAHAARAFFLNGGSLLYISRIYHNPASGGDGLASRDIAIQTTDPSVATFRARWPGNYGNVLVTVSAVRGGDVGIHNGQAVQVSGGAATGMILEVFPQNSPPKPDTPLSADRLCVLKLDPNQLDPNGSPIFTDRTADRRRPRSPTCCSPSRSTSRSTAPNQRQDLYARLGLANGGNRAINKVLSLDDPEDEDCMVWFSYAFPLDPDHTDPYPIQLLLGLVGTDKSLMKQYRLEGGDDGDSPDESDLPGQEADPDDVTKKATGLAALAEVDDIAIVATARCRRHRRSRPAVPRHPGPDQTTPSRAATGSPSSTGRRARRSTRSARSAATSIPRTPPCTTRGSRLSTRTARPLRASPRRRSTFRRPASSRASTRAATSPAASSRHRPTRSSTG